MTLAHRSTSVLAAARTLLLWGFAGVLLCSCTVGCVQRRMTIRSDPPGALVYVDDYEIGTTPVSTDFIYYGKRKIRLVKDGCETLTVMQTIPAPWYEYPVLDFFSENFTPGQVRDQHTLDYRLVQQSVTPSEQLLSRAEQLRRGVHASTNTAPVGVGPATAAPAAGVPAGSPEVMPAPQGVGGQTVHPLPPSGR